MGTSSHRRLAHSRPSPAALHRNFGPGRYSGSRTSQARKIPWTPHRTTSGASTPLPSGPADSATRRLTSQFLVQTSTPKHTGSFPMRIAPRRISAITCALVASIATVIGGAVSAAPRLQETDWAAVEEALGRSGQMMPGDVFRIGMPRSDLHVSVEGVPLQATFALGSYAAFKQYDDDTMVMGDLVLLNQEVNGVMSGLVANGFAVTALHNHLNDMTPHVMYMHYEGHGDPLELATALHDALSASATPLSPASPPAPVAPPSGRNWTRVCSMASSATQAGSTAASSSSASGEPKRLPRWVTSWCRLKASQQR